jgi:hypothetical protein
VPRLSAEGSNILDRRRIGCPQQRDSAPRLSPQGLFQAQDGDRTEEAAGVNLDFQGRKA